MPALLCMCFIYMFFMKRIKIVNIEISAYHDYDN